jgi:hypothetical protein
MKRNLPLLALGIVASLVSLFACHKNGSPIPSPTHLDQLDSTQLVMLDSPMARAPYPQSPMMGCAYDPDYGDSIIYPQPTLGQDDVVSPKNNPGPGKYLSWPTGLVIDSVTGAIDVTLSNTGERYAIGFVKQGTADTCITPLVIGGAAYMDSIYVLEEGATQSLPYFDANPSLAPICSGQGNGPNTCSFDVTGSAASQNVAVNGSTGAIDLQKTLYGANGRSGVFGSKPKNGDLASVTIFYKLNDASNMALQRIDVDIVYFNNKSNINPGQIQKINNKREAALTGNLIFGGGNPRPPLIVVVRRL